METMGYGIFLLIICIVGPLVAGLAKLYLVHRDNRIQKPDKDTDVNNDLWKLMEKDILWSDRISEGKD